MISKREIPMLRAILAFLIATFVFLTGFLIGYSVSYLKYQELSRKQEDIRYSLLSLDLEKEFLESCDSFVFQTISFEFDEMGNILRILENRFGKRDARVIEQKKKYTLLEVQHFLNIKNYKEKCDSNMNTILFFYSNIEPYDTRSERVGYMINALKTKNPEEIMTYSFDYDLDTNMIKILKNVYNITSPNTLIINEEIRVEMFESIEDLEKYLG